MIQASNKTSNKHIVFITFSAMIKIPFYVKVPYQKPQPKCQNFLQIITSTSSEHKFRVIKSF